MGDIVLSVRGTWSYQSTETMASWRAASAGKTAVKMSTNLTGMDVCKNPHYILGVFYSKTLRVLAKMPSDYAYKNLRKRLMADSWKNASFKLNTNSTWQREYSK